MYQEECIVHHFARNQDDSWTFTLHADMNQSLTIEELDAESSLAAIYQGIEFGPEITYAEEEAARYQAEVESE